MKIDKTIYSLDTILSLSYGGVILFLEEMADIKLDMFFRLLKLDENSEEFHEITLQCHYLQINIDVCLKALDIMEKHIIRNINVKDKNYRFSLN